MTPQQSLFMYLKLGLTAIVVVGIFVLAAMGKIDASTAIASAVGAVGTLVVALGIAGSGASQAAAVKAVAGLAPNGPPSIAPKGSSAGYGVVGVLFALTLGACFALVTVLVTACQNGQITPQTQAEIAASEALGACIENTYATDSQKVPAESAADIAIDEAVTCAADAIDVANAFSQSPTAGQSAVVAAANANADKMRAAKGHHPAPAPSAAPAPPAPPAASAAPAASVKR